MITRVDRVPYTVAGFGDALTNDLAQGVPAALSFFPARQWREVVEQIAARNYPRAQVTEQLEGAAASLNAPAAVIDNIRLLKQNNTYIIATGQQAGFLGGPLYTLHKALTAIKLARQYEQEAAGAAHFVPLFWVAGDDHDLGEIDHAWFLREDGALARVGARLSAGSAGRSACDAALAAESLAQIRSELETLPPEYSSVSQYCELYQKDNMSGAFAALLRQWLGTLGMVVVEAQGLRPFGKELLLRELEEYDQTYRLIQEAGLSLTQSGYQPGLGSGLLAPHFFIALEPEKFRVRLEPVKQNGEVKFRVGRASSQPPSVPQQAGWKPAPQTFSKSELTDLIRAKPECFSFSAALRPVLQQSVFPVVAAVLGPGEIKYWAQLKKVHEHFSAVWPVVVPRATLTLLNARGQRALRKIGLEPGSPELFAHFEALKEKVLSSGSLAAKLEQQRARIMSELEGLSAEVQASDGGLRSLLEKAQARIEHELGRIIEKTVAAAQEREGIGQARVRYLSALVRPKNSPQERVLACAQFMAQYPALPEDLLAVLEPAVHGHLIVSLG